MHLEKVTIVIVSLTIAYAEQSNFLINTLSKHIKYAGPIVYTNEKPPIIQFPRPPKESLPGLHNNAPIKYIPLPHHDLPILIYQSVNTPPIHVVRRPNNDIPGYHDNKVNPEQQRRRSFFSTSGVNRDHLVNDMETASSNLPPPTSLRSSTGWLSGRPNKEYYHHDDGMMQQSLVNKYHPLLPQQQQQSSSMTTPHIVYRGHPPIHVMHMNDGGRNGFHDNHGGSSTHFFTSVLPNERRNPRMMTFNKWSQNNEVRQSGYHGYVSPQQQTPYDEQRISNPSSFPSIITQNYQPSRMEGSSSDNIYSPSQPPVVAMETPKPKYAIAPKSWHKPPIIIYAGVKPPINVYRREDDASNQQGQSWQRSYNNDPQGSSINQPNVVDRQSSSPWQRDSYNDQFNHHDNILDPIYQPSSNFEVFLPSPRQQRPNVIEPMRTIYLNNNQEGTKTFLVTRTNPVQVREFGNLDLETASPSNIQKARVIHSEEHVAKGTETIQVPLSLIVPTSTESIEASTEGTIMTTISSV